MCIFLFVFPLNPDVPRVRSCECECIHEGVIPYLSISFPLLIVNLRSLSEAFPDDVTPNCRRSALRFSFRRPRSQMEYSAGYFVAADSRILPSRQDQHLLFHLESIDRLSLYCTKIIICPMICSSFFFCGCAAAIRIKSSASLWGAGLRKVNFYQFVIHLLFFLSLIK